jgi:glutaredoxin
MKKILLVILTLLLVGCTSTPGPYDSFAKCITSKNVTMYGTSWCVHCQAQKKLFENSFQYIHFVDCDKNVQTCVDANVNGYPTWNINNTNYPGELTFYNLSRLSGCNT